jgi:N-acetylglucosamine-6-sulfatase
LRLRLGVLFLVACGGAPERAPDREPVARHPSPPNVVVIVVDDLRWDEFGAAGHPYLQTPNIDRLAREGAHFANAFHAVALCSPNRATLLTGQYPSTHGIVDNIARDRASHLLPTFPRALQRAGYRTAFLGKWHMGNDPTPRPGFDYWVSQPGQGRSVNPELFEDGRLHVVEGYTTDLLTDRAVEFIRRERTSPFLVYLAHKAIHPDITQRDDGSVGVGALDNYIPAPRHMGRYDSKTFPRRGNQAPTLGDLADRPAIRRALSRLVLDSTLRDVASTPTQPTQEITIRRRAEMLLAVDESLGRIMAALDEVGQLDSTVIILTSDNGFFYGEHGLGPERRLPYEESIRNALLVRYPGLVPAGLKPAGLVSSVDLAPTVLELAGVPADSAIQGRSMVPLLAGRTAPERALLIESNAYENPFRHLLDMDYRAIRTARYKYIHWIKHPAEAELYDLTTDPLERHNLARDPGMAAVRDSLRVELGRLVVEAIGLPH